MKKGHLDVGDSHKIYYEVHGRGIPFLSIHGGPGGSFKKSHLRFFNLKKNKVILYDQRGCGKSQYENVLKNNTTKYLVEDICKILDHLHIEKVSILGCSWGSTLALCFAIAYPLRVHSLILNGVFLSTKREIQRLYDGSLALFFPDVWNTIRTHIPKEKSFLKVCHTKIVKEKSVFYYNILTSIDAAALTLAPQPLEPQTEWSDSYMIYPHYMINSCFIPDNFILSNIRRIDGIPLSIVQGKQDFLCPPYYAFTLAKNHNTSQIEFGVGAHSRSEPDVQRKLKRAIMRHTLALTKKNSSIFFKK